jgi:hypothetical protein
MSDLHCLRLLNLDWILSLDFKVHRVKLNMDLVKDPIRRLLRTFCRVSTVPSLGHRRDFASIKINYISKVLLYLTVKPKPGSDTIPFCFVQLLVLEMVELFELLFETLVQSKFGVPLI